MLEFIQIWAWANVVWLIYQRCRSLDPKSRHLTAGAPALGATAAAHVLATPLWPSWKETLDAITAVAVFAFLAAIHGVRRVAAAHRDDAIRH
jgi:hypothetical protein